MLEGIAVSNADERRMAMNAASVDFEKAQQIIVSMADTPYKRQAQRRFDEGYIGTVRSFF